MHVVLINQFYPPAQVPTGVLLADLAQALCKRGHRVTVVTSRGEGGERPGDELRETDGVTICRTGPARRNRTGLPSKLADYVGFFRHAGRVVARLSPAPDVVLSMTTPPFCGMLARRLKIKRGIPYVLWCMDIYPEALVANRSLRPQGLPARLLQRCARQERTGAAAVITLGPDMSARVCSSTPAARVVEVPVWSRLQPSPAACAAAAVLRCERGWMDSDVVLMYSGNMGRAHTIARFAELARNVGAGRPRMRFVMCGSGPAAAGWKKAGGTAFEWLAPVGADEVAAHLLAADIHLISQQQDWAAVVVPSKYQAACALGRPVLFDGPADSSVARWIRKGATGWVLTDGDMDLPVPLLTALQDRAQVAAKGGNAYEQGQCLFIADHNVIRIAEILEQAIFPSL